MPALCAPVTSISWTSTSESTRRRPTASGADGSAAMRKPSNTAPRAARASTAGAAGVPGGVAVGTITAPRGTRLTSRTPVGSTRRSR